MIRYTVSVVRTYILSRAVGAEGDHRAEVGRPLFEVLRQGAVPTEAAQVAPAIVGIEVMAPQAGHAGASVDDSSGYRAGSAVVVVDLQYRQGEAIGVAALAGVVGSAGPR